jgi:hypothetical protein
MDHLVYSSQSGGGGPGGFCLLFLLPGDFVFQPTRGSGQWLRVPVGQFVRQLPGVTFGIVQSE